MNFKKRKEIIEEIENIIQISIEKKIKSYKPETQNMPFHYRLLGKDKMALFSFIHSLNTTFGISIFEPIAEKLGTVNFIESKKQFNVGTQISEEAQNEIREIINELTTKNKKSNKMKEIERIRKVINKGKKNKIRSVKVDLFLKDKNENIYLFEIKTAKPNSNTFKNLKQTLLEWIAIYLTENNNPTIKINSYIAIPYNPYEPKKYERWTLKGIFDIKNELKVGNEFWDFLGGEGTYKELLDCFERVGNKLKTKIDKYFEKFK